MAYRIKPDGTIECDTLDEALAVQGALSRKDQPAEPEAIQAKPQPVAQPRGGDSPNRARREWSALVVRDYLASLEAEYVEMVRQALESGSSMTTLEFAELWGHDKNGVGRRFRTLRDRSKQVAPALPVAIELDGQRGKKHVKVDPSFAAAYKELTDMS